VAQVCVDPRDTTGLACSILDVLARRADAQRRVDALRAKIMETVDWTRVSAAHGELLAAARVGGASERSASAGKS
jgi:hypothetical protein